MLVAVDGCVHSVGGVDDVDGVDGVDDVGGEYCAPSLTNTMLSFLFCY